MHLKCVNSRHNASSAIVKLLGKYLVHSQNTVRVFQVLLHKSKGPVKYKLVKVARDFGAVVNVVGCYLFGVEKGKGIVGLYWVAQDAAGGHSGVVNSPAVNGALDAVAAVGYFKPRGVVAWAVQDAVVNLEIAKVVFRAVAFLVSAGLDEQSTGGAHIGYAESCCYIKL